MGLSARVGLVAGVGCVSACGMEAGAAEALHARSVDAEPAAVDPQPAAAVSGRAAVEAGGGRLPGTPSGRVNRPAELDHARSHAEWLSTGGGWLPVLGEEVQKLAS